VTLARPPIARLFGLNSNSAPSSGVPPASRIPVRTPAASPRRLIRITENWIRLPFGGQCPRFLRDSRSIFGAARRFPTKWKKNPKRGGGRHAWGLRQLSSGVGGRGSCLKGQQAISGTPVQSPLQLRLREKGIGGPPLQQSFVFDITSSGGCDVHQCRVWGSKMGGGIIVGIPETSTPSKDRTLRDGAAKKTRTATDGACFNDWKRFCAALREIASGENGRPLPGFEAQRLAQAVLIECGYTWPGRANELPRSTSCVEGRGVEE
jgi:hypothetical protein